LLRCKSIRTDDSRYREDLTLVRGTEDIFADMGLPDPEGAYAKAQLAYAIRREIITRGLSQREAALIARVKQPQISDITRGRLTGFSIDLLTTILNRFDQDVDSTIHPKRGNIARKAVINEPVPPSSVVASGADR
jgi:predicted XRE-type DNA-binding protein